MSAHDDDPKNGDRPTNGGLPGDDGGDGGNGGGLSDDALDEPHVDLSELYASPEDPSPFAPLFLLADSQLLFQGAGGRDSILEQVRQHLPDSPRAAYLGAANGEEPTFYELFEAAMDGAGIGEARMVRSIYGDDDRDWLEGADLVVLSGGDVDRGWRAFRQAGIDEALQRRYADGAVLLGVSAGAVHLGWGHLNLVSALIGAHDEEADWGEVRRRMGKSREKVRGLGIPTGGALVYHPDGAVEAVRRPVHELVWDEDGEEVRTSLLLPPQEGEEEGGEDEGDGTENVN